MLTFETVHNFFTSENQQTTIVGYDELDTFLLAHTSKAKGYIELFDLKSKTKKQLHFYDSIHTKCLSASIHLKANLLGNLVKRLNLML
jgi:hypothetical protein